MRLIFLGGLSCLALLAPAVASARAGISDAPAALGALVPVQYRSERYDDDRPRYRERDSYRARPYYDESRGRYQRDRDRNRYRAPPPRYDDDDDDDD